MKQHLYSLAEQKQLLVNYIKGNPDVSANDVVKISKEIVSLDTKIEVYKNNKHLKSMEFTNFSFESKMNKQWIG